MFLGGKPVEMLGKLYYRTADGKIIDLPSDMTKEQVIKLEADARAAITKIGKGPAPKPVPDVKQLDKKVDKKTQLKPFAKGERPGGGGKGGGKPRAGGSPSLAGVGSGKVAQYLASKAAPIVAMGFARLQQLRQSQQTHDDAGEKRVQTEKAVLIPDSEGHSKSNAGQVSVVGDRPAPKVDANKGKQTLLQTLRENMPKSVEDVDNFKRDQKAQHTGAEVLKTIQEDKSTVVSTFQDMRNTPAPAPREHEPEALPPQEIAPPTSAMALGKDGIAPLQKEHTDLSNFTNEADKKLNEEGVTQDQLNMVDSGDLATANKEKKGMEKSAKEEPLAVQKFAQQQGQSVETDLKQEETKRRGELTAKRKAGLAATKTKQQGAKSALEKKRDEVAAKINGIYTTAQDKVKKRLADLEVESMQRFDVGNNKASKEFEDTVNREIDAFKDDRYSGWFGWARKVRDWIKGIDDLPAVKAIFDRNREKFVSNINKLVEDISADNKRVIQECKDELQRARNTIKEYVATLKPSLQGIGKKAADEMNSKLDEMDKFVAKKEEDLQNKLKDKQTAAIKAIDEKIEKMKEAMSGALAKLGKLLLLAAKKFFTWALEKVGFSLSDIEGIISKGAAVLKAIFTKPIQFVKNLMNAAITGFKNFGKNFLTHLKDALFEWLTGSLEGLVLPQTWDFPGIISVALQMIGISYQNIRKHMVDVMGEPVVAGLEKTFELVKTLITKGPMAAWDQLKDMAAEMRDAFIEAVKSFIQQKIIEQAITWLVSLFIPGAGIVKAIIGIYDTVVFFIKKAKQIMEMISNFLGSISEIAAGNIGAAADAMEKGLARGLSLVINFLAALLRLSGITNKIRDAIQKIRAKVDAVLLRVAKWIAEKAKALISKAVGTVKKGVAAAKAGVAKLVQWWKVRKEVRVPGGVTHVMFLKGEAAKSVLMIRSEEMTYERFLDVIEGKPEANPTQKAAIAKARPLAKAADVIKAKDYGGTTDAEKEAQALIKQKDLDKALEDLRKETVNIFGSDIPDSTQPFKADVYGGGGDAMGSAMEVKPLTFKLKEKGSKPTTAGHRVYDDINLRKSSAGSNASFYIRGHLLNQNLGGKGQWTNMTPLSRSGNSQHEGAVEAIVKRAVDSGAIIHYQVHANYGARGDKQALKTAITSSDPNPAHVPVKLKIIDAEDHVPASLSCSAFVITKKPDGNFAPVTTLLSGKSVTNDISRSAGEYHVTGSIPPAKVNLNARHFQEYLPLKRDGLTPVQAMRLVFNLQNRQPQRAYGSYDIFVEENKKDIPEAILRKIADDDDVKLGDLGARINKFPS
jgi:hypothetical protein